MSPELGLVGGCGPHAPGELGALWDAWNCRWAMTGVGGEVGLPRAPRSKCEGLCVHSRFCSGSYCPQEGINVNER